MNDRDNDSTDQQHPTDIQSEVTDSTEAESNSDEPEDEDGNGQTDHKNSGGCYWQKVRFSDLLRSTRATRPNFITTHSFSIIYTTISVPSAPFPEFSRASCMITVVHSTRSLRIANCTQPNGEVRAECEKSGLKSHDRTTHLINNHLKMNELQHNQGARHAFCAGGNGWISS
jgi:hypothetical protein